MNDSTIGKQLIENYFKYLRGRYGEARDRASEIKKAVSAVEAKGIIIKEHRDVIRTEFVGSIQRYLFGFYEDAIYHSCFAVEFALMHNLSEKLGSQRKKEIHGKMNTMLNEKAIAKKYANTVIRRMIENKLITPGKEMEAVHVLIEGLNNQELRLRTESMFGFRQIIRESKKEGLIDQTTCDLANKLNDIRNTYFHPQNFVSAMILQHKAFLKWPKIVQAYFATTIPLLRVLATFPDYSWAAKDQAREEAEKKVVEYQKEMEKNVKGMRIKELWGMLGRDAYFRKIANDSIDLSFQILVRIGFY